MNNPSQERRRYPRIYRNFILTFHPKGKPGAIQEVSQINNISKGGASFVSKCSFDEGSVLIINLKAPFVADPMLIEGIVLECKEKIPSLIYEIRLQFNQLSEEVLGDLEKIEQYSNKTQG